MLQRSITIRNRNDIPARSGIAILTLRRQAGEVARFSRLCWSPLHVLSFSGQPLASATFSKSAPWMSYSM
jgi:hypothetical protein